MSLFFICDGWKDNEKPFAFFAFQVLVGLTNIFDGLVSVLSLGIVGSSASLWAMGQEIRFSAKHQKPAPDHFEIVCPRCGGPADNGHDRCLPPNPYNCTKCEGKEGAE